MRTACFIPIKLNSERVPGKNFRLLNGKKLYEYVCEHAKQTGIFDDIYVDTNSEEITKYAKELSELLPLINFWFMPSIYPATAEEIHNKFIFVIEVLSNMGLPLMEEEDIKATAEKWIKEISPK